MPGGEGGETSAPRPVGGLCLAIDTSGERCSACLLDIGSGRVLSQAEPVIGRGHAERLMDLVGERLAEARAGYADLARIAVAVGPGSFTGIRVGVSAARGLSLALAVPAIGVGVLEALAEPHLRQGVAVLAVQNARRGELFAALYAADGLCLRPPAAIPPDALAAFAQTSGGGGPLLTGSGAPIAAEHLRGARTVDTSGHAPIAEIARIGTRRAPGAAPKPIYLRAADARPQAPSRLLRDPGSLPAPPLR